MSTENSQPPSPRPPSRDPLHGVTLESIIKQLVAWYGWGRMADRIPIRCFMFEPTVNSSLKFLRKNPWARQKVEEMFVAGEMKRRREAAKASNERKHNGN
ncbi:MAG: VF530 family protein [Verrucomicrobiia bacterium]|jgi:uncharacterized protein (DUF2132 family)